MENLTGIGNVDLSLVTLEMQSAGIQFKEGEILSSILDGTVHRNGILIGRFGDWWFYRRTKDWVVQAKNGKGLTTNYFQIFSAKWPRHIRPLGVEKTDLFSRLSSNKNLTVDRVVICSQKCLNDFVRILAI